MVWDYFIKKAIDVAGDILSPEQNVEFEKKLLESKLEFEKLEKESLKSAREADIQISTSSNANSLNKNIRPILALMIVGSVPVCLITNNLGLTTVSSETFALLGTMAGGILTYYFDGTYNKP